MDPEVCLKEMRELSKNLMGDNVYAGTWALQLAERVEAMDEWLSKGGFPPRDWVSKTRIEL